MSYYTYLHLKADTSEVFYVGKGKASRSRANSDLNRSLHWHNVVAKHGLLVQIAAHWTDEEDAYLHEVLLIACFRDIGAPLVNLTEGGDGVRGHKHSEEFRQWQADRVKALFSEPGYRERHRDGQLRRFNSEAARAKLGEQIRAGWTDEKRAIAAVQTRARFARDGHPRQKVDPRMLDEMVAMRASGSSFTEIGERFGLSKSRTSVVVGARIRSAHPDVRVLT
jgi:hypothetical protein